MTDFLIRNGNITCPDQGIDDTVMDVLIRDGVIEQIAPSIESTDVQVLDAKGHIVTPALIDLHTHIYWGATSLGVNAENVAHRSGTGTFVDAGSAGGGNFLGFREFIANRIDLRCFAFLNVSFAGIFGFSKKIMVGEGEIARLIDTEMCEQTARDNSDIIVGIKVRAGAHAAGENGALAIDVGRKVASKLNLPLMCHVDAYPPSISEGLAQLQKGDLLTHCSKPSPNSVLEEDGSILPALKKAIERGVLLDIGHGMGGFAFDTCERMLKLGIKPDTISSDIHALCVDGPSYDQLNTLNKLIALGMPMVNAIAACTINPAKVIRQDQLGSLKVGTPADISIFKWHHEQKTFIDAPGEELTTEKHLVCKSLFVAGKQIGANGKAKNSITFESEA